jgi:hypothetical protein
VTVSFALQVKNKLNGVIAFPAFILGAGLVTNSSIRPDVM